MNDRRHPPVSPNRPAPAPRVPESQSDALRRRQSLDEQQRAFQGAIPAPHLFRHRPPS